jgi:hypothetical protein
MQKNPKGTWRVKRCLSSYDTVLNKPSVFVMLIMRDPGADQVVLSPLASVTGDRLYTADPTSIGNAYLSISAEQ